MGLRITHAIFLMFLAIHTLPVTTFHLQSALNKNFLYNSHVYRHHRRSIHRERFVKLPMLTERLFKKIENEDEIQPPLIDLSRQITPNKSLKNTHQQAKSFISSIEKKFKNWEDYISPPLSSQLQIIQEARQHLGKNNKPTVANLNELRDCILQRNQSLFNIHIPDEIKNQPNIDLSVLQQNHPVLQLIKMRYKTKSKPKSRSKNDPHHLSLSIEGGGMRGAVSAGMTTAISVLNLSDCFDSIYGSSAGSIVGSYFLSRQIDTMDVYTELLPAAKRRFLCEGRIMGGILEMFVKDLINKQQQGSNMMDDEKKNTVKKMINLGVNTTFILDDIMSSKNGLRPFDIKAFQLNDAKQPLKVIASSIRDDKFETVAFSSQDGDFFPNDGDKVTFSPDDATKTGLFSCLEASMQIPGATGPPLKLNRHKHQTSTNQEDETSHCFDAFGYEGIPLRSPVQDGATHVLALRSAPEGCNMKTKPTVFSKGVAPLYFNSNNMPKVAEYFECGGQLYRYLEDALTLNEGLVAGCRSDTNGGDSLGVPVPPTDILYGVDNHNSTLTNPNTWKRAHLLPIVVPKEYPQLSSLSQDQNEILEGVRYGFVAAFQMLAPVAGVEYDDIDARQIAQIFFPKRINVDDSNILEKRVKVKSAVIAHDDDENDKQIMKQLHSWLGIEKDRNATGWISPRNNDGMTVAEKSLFER